MNESRGIKGVGRIFRSHARSSQLPQLVVHEREQFGSGLAVSLLSSFEKASHLGHGPSVMARAVAGNLKAAEELLEDY